jgi:DUF4097 and DUF4098 domain-containing protein YvlB
MKALQTIIFLFMASALLLAQNKIERKFEIGSGSDIDIDLHTGGSIIVIGWDKELVELFADVDDDIEDYRIDFREHSSGLSIDVGYSGHGRHSGDVEITIRVPKKSNLELETVGGDISIDNIEGKIGGETMGGEIELSNLKGKIELTTMGGEIDVKNSNLDGELKTMGGNITFENVSGDVKGTTMGGDVKYKGEGRDRDRDKNREVSISTMGGDIKVDDAPGGANVSTMGGEIRIGSAGKYVKAKTMGGDIEVKEVDGGFKLSTMGGDVTAKMIGNPDTGDRDIDISSMGGDINVTVPPGLSMRFDLKLTYTKRSSGSYQIISDFPVKIEESEDWDYSNGSPRKIIYGSGEVAGGKYKVKIETINGNIVIRKGQ